MCDGCSCVQPCVNTYEQQQLRLNQMPVELREQCLDLYASNRVDSAILAIENYLGEKLEAPFNNITHVLYETRVANPTQQISEIRNLPQNTKEALYYQWAMNGDIGYIERCLESDVGPLGISVQQAMDLIKADVVKPAEPQAPEFAFEVIKDTAGFENLPCVVHFESNFTHLVKFLGEPSDSDSCVKWLLTCHGHNEDFKVIVTDDRKANKDVRGCFSDVHGYIQTAWFSWSVYAATQQQAWDFRRFLQDEIGLPQIHND